MFWRVSGFLQLDDVWFWCRSALLNQTWVVDDDNPQPNTLSNLISAAIMRSAIMRLRSPANEEKRRFDSVRTPLIYSRKRKIMKFEEFEILNLSEKLRKFLTILARKFNSSGQFRAPGVHRHQCAESPYF